MKPGPWLTATSNKHQATSNKLRQIVARQNVALTDKPESGFKRQASSFRLQAIQKIFDVGKSLKLWFMLQASGYKVPDLCTFIKFWNVKRGIKNQDKCIQWMLHVKGYLVWRKFNFVSFCNF